MSDASTSCPRCGSQVDHLVSVDTGMRFALKATGQADNLPAEVCNNCYQELATNVSKGFKLRVEREARDKNKVIMWKSRVALVKQARALMENKSYSEAAVAYEKYLRILEVTNNLKRGELNPNVFSNSTRSKEMSVVASVYWDLMRIYDTNAAYGDRMKASAEKLALFLPFSPLFPDIVRKAETFARSAKNPHIVREFLRLSKKGRGPCFIATAVFDDEPEASELWVFRQFRDQVLAASSTGRRLIRFYYRYSPAFAENIRGSQWKKRMLKPLFRKIAEQVSKHLNSRPDVGELEK